MSATITRRLFTVDEFIRLDQLNFFAPEERLELIDGDPAMPAWWTAWSAGCTATLIPPGLSAAKTR